MLIGGGVLISLFYTYRLIKKMKQVYKEIFFADLAILMWPLLVMWAIISSLIV